MVMAIVVYGGDIGDVGDGPAAAGDAGGGGSGVVNGGRQWRYW